VNTVGLQHNFDIQHDSHKTYHTSSPSENDRIYIKEDDDPVPVTFPVQDVEGEVSCMSVHEIS
jgi:hypothetical protein